MYLAIGLGIAAIVLGKKKTIEALQQILEGFYRGREKTRQILDMGTVFPRQRDVLSSMGKNGGGPISDSLYSGNPKGVAFRDPLGKVVEKGS